MVKAEAPIPTTESSSSLYYETVPLGLTREEFEDLKPINVIYGLPAPTSTERLDVMDEERRVPGFSIIGGDHRLRNYKSVTSVHEVKRDVKVRLNLQKLASVAEAGQVITDRRGGLSTSGYRKDLDAQFFTTSQCKHYIVHVYHQISMPSLLVIDDVLYFYVPIVNGFFAIKGYLDFTQVSSFRSHNS